MRKLKDQLRRISEALTSADESPPQEIVAYCQSVMDLLPSIRKELEKVLKFSQNQSLVYLSKKSLESRLKASIETLDAANHVADMGVRGFSKKVGQ